MSDKTAELMESILYEVKRVVVGQDRFLERVLVALLAFSALVPNIGLKPDALLAGFSNPALITIVALLVIRLAPLARAPDLPEAIRLPPGESARAVTLGSDWIAVVTVDGDGQERIRVLDRATGADRASLLIEN